MPVHHYQFTVQTTRIRSHNICVTRWIRSHSIFNTHTEYIFKHEQYNHSVKPQPTELNSEKCFHETTSYLVVEFHFNLVILLKFWFSLAYANPLHCLSTINPYSTILLISTQNPALSSCSFLNSPSRVCCSPLCVFSVSLTCLFLNVLFLLFSPSYFI